MNLSYLGLILFIIFFEFVRGKETKFDYLTFFNLIFILMLPLPALTISSSLENPEWSLKYPFPIDINDVKILFSVYIGYFTILFGYYSYLPQRYAKRITIKWFEKKVVFRISLSLLFVSLLATQLYCLQFGGVVSAISQSTLIRMDLAEGAGPLSFLQHFMFLSYFCSYLFISLLQSKFMSRYKLFISLLFILSAINSVVATLVTGGRANLIFYFLTFYLANLIVTNKISWVITISLLLFAIVFTLYGKTFFFSLSFIQDGFWTFQQVFVEQIKNQSSEGSFFENILSNFSFPLFSLNTALNSDYSLRLFVDWIYGIITFLPERILNVEVPETISTINTRLIAGSNDFEVPTGMFAFAIYSLSWPGLLIVCYLYGWIGRYLQGVIYYHLLTNKWMPFLYVIFLKIWIDFFTAGDPRVFLFSDFWALIGNFILFIFASKIIFSKTQFTKRIIS